MSIKCNDDRRDAITYNPPKIVWVNSAGISELVELERLPEECKTTRLQLKCFTGWLVGIDEKERLNFLQNNGLISDNCITWDDVSEADAAAALADEKRLKAMAKEWRACRGNKIYSATPQTLTTNR
jgi:hypothetical protein